MEVLCSIIQPRTSPNTHSFILTHGVRLSFCGFKAQRKLPALEPSSPVGPLCHPVHSGNNSAGRSSVQAAPGRPGHIRRPWCPQEPSGPGWLPAREIRAHPGVNSSREGQDVSAGGKVSQPGLLGLPPALPATASSPGPHHPFRPGLHNPASD